MSPPEASVSLLDRHVIPFVGTGVHLSRARDLLLLVQEHLLPLRQPTRRPTDREQDREDVHRKLHGFVDDPRIKIDVGIQLARHEILFLERDALELQRDVRSEEHTSELQSLAYLVCRLLLEKKKKIKIEHEIKSLNTSIG